MTLLQVVFILRRYLRFWTCLVDAVWYVGAATIGKCEHIVQSNVSSMERCCEPNLPSANAKLTLASIPGGRTDVPRVRSSPGPQFPARQGPQFPAYGE